MSQTYLTAKAHAEALIAADDADAETLERCDRDSSYLRVRLAGMLKVQAVYAAAFEGAEANDEPRV